MPARLEPLSEWLESMRGVAVRMREIWEASRFDRAAMIVGRGDDSSAWNALAGAWNAARQGWIATIEALGMGDVLDLVCLGKAMRLMAGDVAAWHGVVHPDTAVWATLPPPWEVFLGAASCTRSDVEIACAREGLDPIASGWISARRTSEAVPFRPTRELVHGVAVSNPELAVILRKANWFSGKPGRALPEGVQMAVRRDSNGWALGVDAMSAPRWLRRLFSRDRDYRP